MLWLESLTVGNLIGAFLVLTAIHMVGSMVLNRRKVKGVDGSASAN